MMESLPSRLYLPSFGYNGGAKNRAEGDSDIKTILENDLQVVPLAVDHDRRNGFQYQPIISQQYSRVSVEYPRYSQSAVPKLPHDPRSRNTWVLDSPISNGENEPKPITNSQQLSPKAGSPDSPVENQPRLHPQTASWCTRRFQSHLDEDEDRDEERSFVTPAKLPRQKMLTVNDQGSNTARGKLRLQLTPPSSEDEVDVTIPGATRNFYEIEKATQNSAAKSFGSSSISGLNRPNKGMVLIGQPANRGGNEDRQDSKPVYESFMEYGANYENDRYDKVRDNYRERDYQLGNGNTGDQTRDSFGGHHHPLMSLKNLGTYTCGYAPVIQTVPLRGHQRCNYWAENCRTRERVSTNPALALTLSRHGIYLPRSSEPRVYAHLALNNIHNNKPSGNYKFARDEAEAEERASLAR